MTPDPQEQQPSDAGAAELGDGGSAAVPECQDCGACCFWETDRYVYLWGGDHAALTPAEQRTLTEWHQNRCFMRMEDDHCAALKVEGGRFTCSVYERRPFLCSELERGSDGCLAALERSGELARRFLARQRERSGGAAQRPPG